MQGKVSVNKGSTTSQEVIIAPGVLVGGKVQGAKNLWVI